MRTPSLVAAVAGFGLALACGDSPAEPDPATLPVVWSHVSLGADARVQTPMRSVVRTREEWTALWAQVYPPGRPVSTPPLPEIDFRREMVIVVAMGTRPTNGYSTRIVALRSRPDHLEVHVESVDGPYCGNLQAVTMPRSVVRASPRRDDVRFVEEVTPCRRPP